MPKYINGGIFHLVQIIQTYDMDIADYFCPILFRYCFSFRPSMKNTIYSDKGHNIHGTQLMFKTWCIIFDHVRPMVTYIIFNVCIYVDIPGITYE